MTMFQKHNAEQTDVYQYAIATAFICAGLMGLWLHLKNLSRLSALNSILPRNLVKLHYCLAVACLGSISPSPFTALGAYLKRWPFGNFGCHLYGFHGMFFGMTSIYLSCFICFFTAVDILNLKHVRCLTPKRCNCVIYGIWGIGLLWAVLPIFGYSKYTLEPHQTSCLLDWNNLNENHNMAYLYALCIIGYALPVGMAIWSQYMMMTQQSMSSPKKTEKNDDKIKMLIKLNNSILLITIVGWLPFGVLTLNALLSNPIAISPFIYYFPQLMAKFGEALMPIAYSETLKRLENCKKTE
ncbi:unnamed protein product [Trichobilharzia szidati]|nr:unnamed protein product [Trichobilharzia szidati]